MRMLKGQVWRFVHDLQAINHIVIPQHPVVPDPLALLASIPTGNKFLTVTELCNAFFSISQLMKLTNTFLCSLEKEQFTWTEMPRSFTESPYFSQILKTDLDDITSKGSTLLQYVDDFTSLLFFSSLLTGI